MGPHITGNGEASGFITPAGVREISARMGAGDPSLLEQYAVRGGLGLIEANDLSIGGRTFASEPRVLQPRDAKKSSATGRGTIRGPSLEWLVLLGIMSIVVMVMPASAPVDSIVALILLPLLLMAMLAVRVVMRLFSSSTDK